MFRSSGNQPTGRTAGWRPRGIIPLSVTAGELVLAKSAKEVRLSNEIRQALQHAADSDKRFVLKVPKGAAVDPALRTAIERYNGAVTEDDISSYSVYVGLLLPSGEEGDGWVFGEAAAYESFVGSLKSTWLKEHLRPGLSIAGIDLLILESELRKEFVDVKNIDGENLTVAIGELVAVAKYGGSIFIQ